MASTATFEEHDGLGDGEDDVSWEDLRKHLKWSEARIKAFVNRKENPNAYYYRFNAPGEEQRTGEWSEEEEKRFFEAVKRGIDYRWGIFSMKFPGRVGYQCSNREFVLLTPSSLDVSRLACLLSLLLLCWGRGLASVCATYL